jgi:hypothetical protein
MADRSSDAATAHTARTWVNLVLLVLVVTATFIFFNVHVKPHMDARLFGGVTLLAAAMLIIKIVKFFVGEAAKKSTQSSITRSRTTWLLVFAIPILIAAYLTTGTVVFVPNAKLSEGKPVSFVVSRDGAADRPETLTAKKSEAAVTLPFIRAPRILRVQTQLPEGFGPAEIDLRPGFKEVELPLADTRKDVHLVRLVPGRNLFRIFGVTDTGHRLRVLRLSEVLVDQPFLRFETLYLGASQADTARESKAVHGSEAHKQELREYMRTMQPPPPEEGVRLWVDRWMTHSRVVATPDLKAKDPIRVILRRPDGSEFVKTFDIDPGVRVQTVFLEGMSP